MVMIMAMIMVVIMIVVVVMIMVVVIIMIMMMVMTLVIIVLVVIPVPVAPAGRIIAVIIAVTRVVTVISGSRSRTERHSAETNYSGGSKGWCDKRPAEFRHGECLLWMAAQ